MCRFDTVLTDQGKRDVRSAAGKVGALNAPDLLVVSPLTRALQSAELAFEGVDCPRIVHPLATERLEHSSDVRQLQLGLFNFPLHARRSGRFTMLTGWTPSYRATTGISSVQL